MLSRRIPLLITALVLALLLGLGLAAVSTASQGASVFTVTMTGDQEVWANPACAPPLVCGDPDATGTARIVVSPASDRVCFNIRWSGIDGGVWGAHIHGPATTLEAAPIRVAFLMLTPGADDNLSGTDHIAGCVASSDWADQIAANPGSFYVNVHSTVYGPGAIRAQLGS
jgi:hypothetical protein